MNNDTIHKIYYSSLVLAPLLSLERSINTDEILEYKVKLAELFAEKGKRIEFDTDKSSKLIFELAHAWWIRSTKLNPELTKYSLIFKDDTTKMILARGIDRNVIEILTSEEALSVFKSSKALKKEKNEL